MRHDIQLVMPSDRVVISMGHTTEDSAVVFTAERAGVGRREEKWSRQPDGWKLETSTAITADVTTGR